MKLHITTWQRLSLVTVVNNPPPPHTIPVIRKASKLLDILELSPEEREQVGLGPDEATGGIRWADAEHCWDLEIADSELADYLKQLAESWEHWDRGNPRAVLDLAEQLGI